MAAVVLSYQWFRYPAGIISHCVWLYHRFPLSFGEVEEMMLARGIVVSPRPSGRGVRSSGRPTRTGCAADGHARATHGISTRCSSRSTERPHYLWWAVDQDGVVLDILVQSRRNATAATKFFRRLLTGLRYAPRVVITDKLRSYGAALRAVMPSVEHRSSKYLNNRAENVRREVARNEWITRIGGRYRSAA